MSNGRSFEWSLAPNLNSKNQKRLLRQLPSSPISDTAFIQSQARRAARTSRHTPQSHLVVLLAAAFCNPWLVLPWPGCHCCPVLRLSHTPTHSPLRFFLRSLTPSNLPNVLEARTFFVPSWTRSFCPCYPPPWTTARWNPWARTCWPPSATTPRPPLTLLLPPPHLCMSLCRRAPPPTTFFIHASSSAAGEATVQVELAQAGVLALRLGGVRRCRRWGAAAMPPMPTVTAAPAVPPAKAPARPRARRPPHHRHPSSPPRPHSQTAANSRAAKARRATTRMARGAVAEEGGDRASPRKRPQPQRALPTARLACRTRLRWRLAFSSAQSSGSR